jgi:hypothetical protein
MIRAWWALPLLIAACGPKKAQVAATPISGWHQEEGWLGSCYFSPNFEDLGKTDRRMIRQQVLDEMMSQWSGGRDDGIKVGSVVVEGIETVLLGLPDKIEDVIDQNSAFCKTAMTGAGAGAWEAWLNNLPRKLMEGECRRPQEDTLYSYLDLGMVWQVAVDVCDDDIIEITASEMDEYRVDDDGPWINAAGDMDKSTAGMSDYPCDVQGCFAGQVVLRFRGDSGVSFVRPVGNRLVFEPPEHGVIDVTFNDPTSFNNEFRVVRGVQHRTGVTYTSLD